MLLDTCSLLWLASDQAKISDETLKRIDESTVLYISAITCFEISLKQLSGKLTLPLPARQWFELTLEHHDIEVIPLNMDVSLKATELPSYHKDPCDRFIIATALLNKYPVITADKHFSQYGVEVLT